MSVRPIDRKTVHQICSGQVVLSLAVAVKELVENSLDAGATTIDVRLKEHGSELVEVTDNGYGVEEVNFQGLTLKHHTSKIQDFSDLEVGVTTFGFRGEALSSMCALSADLTVTTRHKSAPVATKLEYDNNGVIRSQGSCAREVGTTVSLSRLFHTLPVRHKEFLRNIKKEFNKMVHMLQGYCLVSTGVRLSCYNQAGKNKRSQVLSIGCNPDIRSNILDVFGPKQLEQLVEFPMCSEKDLAQVEDELHLSGADLQMFKFCGYISRCNHGYGRSAADRQYYFFNNRPCDHSKLSRTVNEVYHVYNRHQYPTVVLNITIARDSIDVNVTPDKRQVMLHHEKTLLLLIKVSLSCLFERMQGEYESQATLKATATSLKDPAVSTERPHPSPATPTLSRFSSLKRNCAELRAERGKTEPASKQAKLFEYRLFGPKTQALPPRSSSDAMSLDENPLSSSPSTSAKVEDISGEGHQSSEQLMDVDTCGNDGRGGARSSEKDLEREVLDVEGKRAVNTTDLCSRDGPSTTSGGVAKLEQEGVSIPLDDSDDEGNSTRSSRLGNFLYKSPDVMTSPVKSKSDPKVPPGSSVKPCTRKTFTISSLDCPSTGVLTEDRSLKFDLEAVTARLKQLRVKADSKVEGEGEGEEGERRFRAKIAPSSNTAAEEELRKEIKKSDFLKMEILGQFNLGFILTRLGNNLFIIDQHATDEKYNFERLQRETVIQHQKLLVPKSLELTAVSESVIMDNLKVFEMNGFQFSIDAEAPPMKRVKLTAKPVSKNWSMEKQDIEELVFLLSDDGCSPGEVVRPSAVRAMFASRACRSSIMVGTALSKAEMRKLVEHMSEMEQPWHCPHGRPTMRHVLDMERLCLQADTPPGTTPPGPVATQNI